MPFLGDNKVLLSPAFLSSARRKGGLQTLGLGHHFVAQGSVFCSEIVCFWVGKSYQECSSF